MTNRIFESAIHYRHDYICLSQESTARSRDSRQRAVILSSRHGAASMPRSADTRSKILF